MFSPITVSLAGVPFRFDPVQVDPTFTVLGWLLDPYRCPENIEAAHHIRSDRFHGPEPSVALLFQEQAGFFNHQVLRTGDGALVWQFYRNANGDIPLQYRVSPDWKEITLLTDETNTGGHTALAYFGQILPTLLLTHDVLTFHGVLMEHEGKGILISADSGVGKTTHARLWRDHKNALILNGDRASCRRENGVWTGYGLPWSGTSGEQICRSVPISALVILERGEENEAHRITGMESFGAAWPHVQKPVWDEALTGRALELTDDFLSSIPVIRLSCRPDPDSVDVLFRALENL